MLLKIDKNNHSPGGMDGGCISGSKDFLQQPINIKQKNNNN